MQPRRRTARELVVANVIREDMEAWDDRYYILSYLDCSYAV